MSYIYANERKIEGQTFFPASSGIVLYSNTALWRQFFLAVHPFFETNFVSPLGILIEGDQRGLLRSTKWCFAWLALLPGLRLMGLEQGPCHPELCSPDALVLLYAAPFCIQKLMLILPLQRLHFASGDSIFKALNISGRIFTSCHILLLKFLVNRGRL